MPGSPLGYVENNDPPHCPRNHDTLYAEDDKTQRGSSTRARARARCAFLTTAAAVVATAATTTTGGDARTRERRWRVRGYKKKNNARSEYNHFIRVCARACVDVGTESLHRRVDGNTAELINYPACKSTLTTPRGQLFNYSQDRRQ